MWWVNWKRGHHELLQDTRVAECILYRTLIWGLIARNTLIWCYRIGSGNSSRILQRMDDGREGTKTSKLPTLVGIQIILYSTEWQKCFSVSSRDQAFWFFLGQVVHLQGDSRIACGGMLMAIGIDIGMLYQAAQSCMSSTGLTQFDLPLHWHGIKNRPQSRP